MIVIVSPLVLIVLAVVIGLAAHLTAGDVISIVTILGASLIATAGIIAFIVARMNPVHNNRADPFKREPIQFPPTMPEAGPLPRPRREAIEPREVHNHLHLDGLQPDQVAEYLRSIRSDNDG